MENQILIRKIRKNCGRIYLLFCRKIKVVVTAYLYDDFNLQSYEFQNWYSQTNTYFLKSLSEQSADVST
jgi:hypothetical protein